MEIKDGLSVAVVEVLDKENYEAWSVRVKTYLMAQDLWETVDATTEPPKQEDDKAAFKAWSNKNSTALNVIRVSCGLEALFEIKETSLAKIAWDTLAEKYNVSIHNNSVVLHVLRKDNFVDWSYRVKTYLIAHDLWDIIEATTEPPRQEDDAAFKAWSKKNLMALHVIQISCGAVRFSEIIEITSAKLAWDTLAEKCNQPKCTNSGSSENGNVDYVQYEALKEALKSGDWNAAEEFLQRKPGAVVAKITISGETALHFAVSTGHEHIVEKLVDKMSEEDLAIQDICGNTALVFAIENADYRMTACMLRKNNNLVSIKDSNSIIPAYKAIFYGHTELARYLYSLTPLEDLTPEKGFDGASICTEAIYSRSLDIALDLIRKCRRLALAPNDGGRSPLYALADMPNAFPSGDGLVFWKRWIYNYCINIQQASASEENCLNIQNVGKSRSDQAKINGSVLALLRQLLSKLVNFLGIKDLYESKLVHAKSHELLVHMCKEVSISNMEERMKGHVFDAIFRSIEKGNFEFLFYMVKANPDLMWGCGVYETSIFSFAVLHRQAKIFSLIYGLAAKKSITTLVDNKGDIMLHKAGMTGASIQINRIPGPALQMQRELQWFKEVESIVVPRFKKYLNKDGLTPRVLFTKNHIDLKKEGEKWMKGTATSCTVVGALIVTIMFAAAFTVPGGNKQDTGFPIFLNEKLFMLFIISDAFSLFSSSTSLLMFLGILTSRYEEDDFLESLPRKMIIGLSTLFFSIAAMMIAFCTALSIMLHGQSWIITLVICLASVPISLFILLKFPLLVDMLISTYGPGIFDKKMERWV